MQRWSSPPRLSARLGHSWSCSFEPVKCVGCGAIVERRGSRGRSRSGALRRVAGGRVSVSKRSTGRSRTGGGVFESRRRSPGACPAASPDRLCSASSTRAGTGRAPPVVALDVVRRSPADLAGAHAAERHDAGPLGVDGVLRSSERRCGRRLARWYKERQRLVVPRGTWKSVIKHFDPFWSVNCPRVRAPAGRPWQKGRTYMDRAAPSRLTDTGCQRSAGERGQCRSRSAQQGRGLPAT